MKKKIYVKIAVLNLDPRTQSIFDRVKEGLL